MIKYKYTGMHTGMHSFMNVQIIFLFNMHMVMEGAMTFRKIRQAEWF